MKTIFVLWMVVFGALNGLSEADVVERFSGQEKAFLNYFKVIELVENYSRQYEVSTGMDSEHGAVGGPLFINLYAESALVSVATGSRELHEIQQKLQSSFLKTIKPEDQKRIHFLPIEIDPDNVKLKGGRLLYSGDYFILGLSRKPMSGSLSMPLSHIELKLSGQIGSFIRSKNLGKVPTENVKLLLKAQFEYPEFLFEQNVVSNIKAWGQAISEQKKLVDNNEFRSRLPLPYMVGDQLTFSLTWDFLGETGGSIYSGAEDRKTTKARVSSSSGILSSCITSLLNRHTL